MKVKIGPYVDEGERQIYVEIHDYDTWGMDHTLGLIVLPMLKQLKLTKHGSPFVDPEDVPEKLRPSEEWTKRYNTDGETDPYFHKRWDWVMDEMIFAFENLLDDDMIPKFTSDTDEVTSDIFESKGIGPAQLRLFPDEDGHMEDYEYYKLVKRRNYAFDKQGYMDYNKRISNGFRLFGKYFQALWD